MKLNHFAVKYLCLFYLFFYINGKDVFNNFDIKMIQFLIPYRKIQQNTLFVFLHIFNKFYYTDNNIILWEI